MNLTGWACAQGVHVMTAYLWYREGTLSIVARKVGRLILVSPGTAAPYPRVAGRPLCAVSAHHQRVDLDRQASACQRGHRRPACPWPGWRPRLAPG